MMHRSLVTLTLTLVALGSAAAALQTDSATVWVQMMIDPLGDAKSGSAIDAAQLSTRYDRAADVIWFRVALFGTSVAEAFGVQLAIDTGTEGSAKAPWWGANKEFKFDRLVTAKGTRRGGAFRGTMGVANAAGAAAGDFTNVSRDSVQLRVDGDAIIVGVRRADLGGATTMNIIAAVGSDTEWTDEIPNLRPLPLDISAPRPTRGLREIDVSRNNFRLPDGANPISDTDLPSIAKRGRTTGRALILVPGVFSGPAVFEPFIARHEADYRFFIVTPPGLNGTRPRRMPAETVSYGDRVWTRGVERDILELIRREQLEKPVLMSHGFPGSLAVTAIAANHPGAIAGAIEIAAMPPQAFPSPADPSGKTLMTPAERVRYQDTFWAPKWFKYVTPETWENNNYKAPMFQRDPDRAEQVRQRIEQHLLPVKVQYLTESNGTDDSADLARIAVPLLALRPAFSAAVLADPANAWFRTSFVDAWNAFSRNANIQLTTLDDSAVLVFDDQPKAADDAVIAFLDRIGVPRARQ
jgi:pimeloyl-ACP methyl ester carboxylesterase